MTHRYTCIILAAALAAPMSGHAAERSVDAIAAGAKLTKADAARTQSPSTVPNPQTQRGIEKKDIRRGMVIAKPGTSAQKLKGETEDETTGYAATAKPGAIAPHLREAGATRPCPPPCGEQMAPGMATNPVTSKQTASDQTLKTKHDTVKNSISNIR